MGLQVAEGPERRHLGEAGDAGILAEDVFGVVGGDDEGIEG